MASSSNEKPDVFISFRGTDTRRGILSHLSKKLREKELIDAYVDDRLKSGTEISSSLLEAIEGSLISLIIFSQDYASSRWCLEELEKIMECKEDNGQIVIPIFYNIEPSHVRNQRGTYGDAFAKHEKRFKDKVQYWRSAMNKAANLSGYHYDPSNFESEAEFIDKIVSDVLEKLKNISPLPAKSSKHLVGFHRHLECVQSLLEFNSPKVRFLGIWGMGGIGKTTLAGAICDKFLSDFENVCFMENIREESKKINGLKYLIHKIYAELLDFKLEEVNMSDVRTRSFIRRRLSRKKVLIVLDDVDNSVQLADLLGELCLGAGSRVIITSRDRLVLECGRVHALHHIEEMNSEESLELFCLHAFNQRQPKMGYEELSKSAVSFAKGVPLALKVLGLHLCPIDKEIWENEIQKLKKYPNKTIENVLKVSYDGLDEAEKNIFLDIAFFFRGHNKDDVKRVLDACGFFATSGIYQLQNKALISISKDYRRIEMHDLLHEMAEQIVRKEDSTGRHIEPRKRSRLNDVEEICELLQNNKGTDAIEGIILDVCKIKKTCLTVDSFRNMSNLRILIIHSAPWSRGSNLNVPSGLELFSNKLRYFRWDEYPLKSLPLTFCTAELIELHMQHSHQVNSLHMTKLPCMTNLKRLSFPGCGQVNEEELKVVFDALCFLEDLDFGFCMNLCSIPDNISSLPFLKSLALDGSNVESFPSSIKHLSLLQRVSLNSCNRLKSLPELPQSIKYLHVQYCPALIEIVASNSNNIEEYIGGEGESEKLNLSFKADVKLGEQGVMQFATSSLIRATKRNSCDPEHEVCYPGSTIPHWFKYKETSETLFAIELDENNDQLLGFVLGGILPQFVDACNICFFFFFKDHYAYSSRVFTLGNSNTDLAFLWFCPFEKIAGKGASEGRKYNHILCGFRCEVSGQAVVGTCGVCPIYASQFDSIIGQIFESEGDNGDADDQDYQQETPLELVESYTPDILEIEFPTDQSNTSHDDDNDDVDYEDDDNNDDDDDYEDDDNNDDDDDDYEDDDDNGKNENGDVDGDDGDDDDEPKEEEPHFHVKLNRINNFSPLDKQNEKKGLQQLLFP